MCVTLHCLPQSGGLLDQDAFLVDMMGIVLEADQEREQLELEKEKRRREADARRRR